MGNRVFSSSFNTPNVESGFCHFGLVFFMVLWQSPDTPVMSCFHVSVLEPCALSSACLVLCSDPGTRVLSFGFVSGFRHSRSVFCLVVWVCGLECARVMQSLVWGFCFVLERGVRIPALVSWVSVSCRGSDTRAPCSVLLCECAVWSVLGRVLFCLCSLCFIGVIVISSPSMLPCVVFCLALPSRVASLVSPTVCFVYLY